MCNRLCNTLGKCATGRCNRGYSLREMVVRVKLANWTDISDVALLKRLRNSAEWLRLLCIELLRENVAYRLEEAISRTIRIVDGTIARQDGKPMNIAPRLSDRNMLRVRS